MQKIGANHDVRGLMASALCDIDWRAVAINVADDRGE